MIIEILILIARGSSDETQLVTECRELRVASIVVMWRNETTIGTSFLPTSGQHTTGCPNYGLLLQGVPE